MPNTQIRAALDLDAPAKAESFYDPTTGENITFDSDRAVVHQ